jgi:hypothetical protein
MAGCALATPPLAVPVQEALPGLEAAVSEDSTHVEAALALALGYAASDRLEEARRLLEATRTLVPSDRTVSALLGMVEQRLGLFFEADRRFDAFLRAHPGDPVASTVAARREAVRPMALLVRARGLLAEPPALDESQGSRRVAILPFNVRAPDTEGAFLAAAFSELTSLGLASTDVALVDPREVRALLEAMGTPVDQPFTVGGAARVGALLGAGSVVYGVLDLSVADSATVEGGVL